MKNIWRNHYFGLNLRLSSLVLNKDVDVSRGDIISSMKNSPKESDHFEIDLAWLGEEEGFKGRRYLVKNEVTMEIEGQEKPAYIAESLTMYVTA